MIDQVRHVPFEKVSASLGHTHFVILSSPFPEIPAIPQTMFCGEDFRSVR